MTVTTHVEVNRTKSESGRGVIMVAPTHGGITFPFSQHFR